MQVGKKMSWFFASLMIVALWLVFRILPKQTRTQRIVSKYQSRSRARNKKYEASLMPKDNTVATEEEREALREEYERQKTFAETRERAEIEAKGYNRY